MAAFTSMALGGLLGYMAAKKLKGNAPQQQQVQAPGPTQTDQNAPAPPLVNPAADNAAALTAAGKTKKRAAAGAAITRGVPRLSTPFKGAPKSLVGY